MNELNKHSLPPDLCCKMSLLQKVKFTIKVIVIILVLVAIYLSSH